MIGDEAHATRCVQFSQSPECTVEALLSDSRGAGQQVGKAIELCLLSDCRDATSFSVLFINKDLASGQGLLQLL